MIFFRLFLFRNVYCADFLSQCWQKLCPDFTIAKYGHPGSALRSKISLASTLLLKKQLSLRVARVPENSGQVWASSSDSGLEIRALVLKLNLLDSRKRVLWLNCNSISSVYFFKIRPKTSSSRIMYFLLSSFCGFSI